MKYKILFLVFLIIIAYNQNTCPIYNIQKELDDTNIIGNIITNIYIPKVIHQTYYDKTKIPNKVFQNIKKYAPDYKHIIYDDNDCINYISTYFGKELVNLFNSLEKGAHKADLFRYCVLYNEGGIYLDIKTELITPINNIFFKPNTVYSVLSINKKTIYQGVIATPPNNKLFLKLIYFMLKIKKPIKMYIIFTKHMYAAISRELNKNKIYSGYNINSEFPNYNYELFTEKCSNNSSNCYDGLDKYNICCNIYKNNKKIIKTRYSDYPW